MNRRVWGSILLGGLAMAIMLLPWPSARSSPGEQVIQLTATQFAYDPNVITVTRGQEVVVELTSGDVVHGLFLDSYDLAISADPGQTARLAFTADKAGSFRFRCSVTCGPLHPFMIGQLRVEPSNKILRIIIGSLLALAAGITPVFHYERPSHV